MADRDLEIRTQSAITLFLAVLAMIGLPLTILMLVATGSRRVGHLAFDLPVAVTFGVGLTCGLALMHTLLSRRTARLLGISLRALEVPRAFQTLQLMMDVDRVRAGVAAAQALRNLGLDRPVADAEGRSFSGTSRMSLTSWGERLEILVTPVDERRSLLQVSSRPVLPTNFIDNGVNLRNVVRLSQAVREAALSSAVR